MKRLMAAATADTSAQGAYRGAGPFGSGLLCLALFLCATTVIWALSSPRFHTADQSYGFRPIAMWIVLDSPLSTFTNPTSSALAGGNKLAISSARRTPAARMYVGVTASGIDCSVARLSLASIDIRSPGRMLTGTVKSWSFPYGLIEGNPLGPLTRFQPATPSIESTDFNRSVHSLSAHTSKKVYSVSLNTAKRVDIKNALFKVLGDCMRATPALASEANCRISATNDLASFASCFAPTVITAPTLSLETVCSLTSIALCSTCAGSPSETIQCSDRPFKF